jgi:hypothetical protein
MEDITTKQPHIVVTLPGSVHVISIVQNRQLAAGAVYSGDKDAMIQILAAAIKGVIDE